MARAAECTVDQSVMPGQGAPAHRDAAIWLLICCGMLAVMVLLGGLTRLTHSGLSMVEWDPIIGAIPPLNLHDWQDAFEKYKYFPEYQQVNYGMTLDQFKGIFWLEYVHRLWGRSIGLVFALPFIWLVLTRRIGKALLPQLAGLFILGGLQGAMGWYMVKSGLVADPAVSHYRLAAHLGLAFLIHAGILWTALDILAANRPTGRGFTAEAAQRAGWLTASLALLAGMLFVTLLFGALVAGLHAGLAFNTFPLMDGELVPSGLCPAGWRDLFEDIKSVQFAHRTLAEFSVSAILVVCGLTHWRLGRQTPRAVTLLALTAVVQLCLGIGTLLLVVPVWLASLHQMGAFFLVTVCLCALHEMRWRRRLS